MLVELLGRVPLFEDLSELDLAEVARVAVDVREPTGVVLAREGEAGHEFLIVLEGRVDISRGDRLITTLGPGAHLGQCALIEDRTYRTTRVTARTSAAVAFVSSRDFGHLLHELPEFWCQIRTAVARRMGHDTDTPSE